MKVNAWICAHAADLQLLVSFRIAEDEQLPQVKRMIRGIVARVVLDPFSNLKLVKSSGYFR